MGRFSAIFRFPVPAAQDHSVPLRFRKEFAAATARLTARTVNVSLRFRKELATATARLLKIMRNRLALGWAPGRPKARFIKAVSGGLGFPWVSQKIRCKARKNWKTSLLGPFFSTARPPAGFLSI